jgi:heme-degrading monooxygenase HmoA
LAAAVGVDTVACIHEGVNGGLGRSPDDDRRGLSVVIVVFVITHRPDMPVAEYEETGNRMVEIVSSMRGFLGMEYAETDGGELLVARFDSHEALAAWRNHPEHQVAQQLGREKFFANYRIDVCEAVRSYEFEAEVTAQV